MRILKTMLKDFAVYWAPAGTDNDGQPKYASPVEYKVRWDDTTVIFANKDGEELAGQAKVTHNLNDAQVNGVLWHGRLSALTTGQKANPLTVVGAFPIKKVEKIPTLNNKEYYRFSVL